MLHEGGNFRKAQRTFPDSKEADSLAQRARVRLLRLEPSGWSSCHNLGVTGGRRGSPLWVPKARLKVNVDEEKGLHQL